MVKKTDNRSWQRKGANTTEERIGTSKAESKRIGTSRRTEERIGTSKAENKRIGTSRK